MLTMTDMDPIDVLILAATPLEHEAARSGIDDWTPCDQGDPQIPHCDLNPAHPLRRTAPSSTPSHRQLSVAPTGKAVRSLGRFKRALPSQQIRSSRR